MKITTDFILLQIVMLCPQNLRLGVYASICPLPLATPLHNTCSNKSMLSFLQQVFAEFMVALPKPGRS